MNIDRSHGGGGLFSLMKSMDGLMPWGIITHLFMERVLMPNDMVSLILCVEGSLQLKHKQECDLGRNSCTKRLGEELFVAVPIWFFPGNKQNIMMHLISYFYI